MQLGHSDGADALICVTGSYITQHRGLQGILRHKQTEVRNKKATRISEWLKKFLECGEIRPENLIAYGLQFSQHFLMI